MPSQPEQVQSRTSVESSMSIHIREATGRADVEPLIPILLLAEPSEASLRWSIRNLSDAVYRADDDGVPVAAATVRWEDDEPEIVELGVAAERQGTGLGRQLVLWIVEEARRRAKRAVVVGTANSSLGNLAFYQKCGFRMHEVRRDYFWYYGQPVYEHGIRKRDLLVFRYALAAEEAPRGRRGRR
jgi:GNAT superfamily N-acetyltransferase